ncbi:MAG: hypothetical protein GF313_01225, partial [Caldithrix sp.]|nr:hypothetical protein [Caldithrix sp.]
TLELQPDSARCMLSVDIDGSDWDITLIKIKLTLEGHEHWHFKTNATKQINQTFEIRNPHLWWPIGMGDQPLYEITIELFNPKGQLLEQFKRRVGIRTIDLQSRAKDKAVFNFIINGQTVFIKGANWIPADSFLTRITSRKYDHLLKMARDAGLNMIRVWGGGIYEQSIFYDLCDQMGLLVWQDFMFACGFYPEHPSFMTTVQHELNENILKLQYHPSLAVWCGNNENEWLWYNTGNPNIAEMPGYSIYHEILPQILTHLDPNRVYLPSSPYGDDENPNAPESGNQHQWAMWSGWQDYTAVVHDHSLFITEFGFQAPANLQTMNRALAKSDRKPQSAMFEFHNKQLEGNERLFRFLAGHLPVNTRWKDFIYLTQLNQGMALQTCIDHWRYRSRPTSGIIIWQLNDCWPICSWSLIDYELTPKLAYYFVQRSFADRRLDIRKNHDQYDFYIDNHSGDLFRGQLHIILFLPHKNSLEDIKKMDFAVKAGQQTRIPSSHLDISSDQNSGIIIDSLVDTNGRLVYRDVRPLKKWKHIKLNKVSLECSLNTSKKYLHIRNRGPQPAFYIDVQHPQLKVLDRGFTLLPDESKIVPYASSFHALSESRLQLMALNNYLNIGR